MLTAAQSVFEGSPRGFRTLAPDAEVEENEAVEIPPDPLNVGTGYLLEDGFKILDTAIVPYANGTLCVFLAKQFMSHEASLTQAPVPVASIGTNEVKQIHKQVSSKYKGLRCVLGNRLGVYICFVNTSQGRENAKWLEERGGITYGKNLRRLHIVAFPDSVEPTFRPTLYE